MSARVESASVRWPDGSVEAIAGLEVGAHHSFRQGGGSAAIVAPRPAVMLARDQEERPATAQTARIVLREPVPLPDDVVAGSRASVRNGRLLTFWASWCVKCQEELKEFTAHHAQIRDAGLTIVPLSVDVPEDHTKALRVEKKLKFPFKSRFVENAQMTLFASVLKEVLDLHREMVIPMSFLLDGEGRIQVIYSGAVSVNQLLSDHRAISSRQGEKMLRETEFPGRWYALPSRSYSAIVTDLKEANLRDWARYYLKLDRARRGR